MQIKILLFVIFLLISHTSKSESILFEYDPRGQLPSPLPHILSGHTVTLNFDMIKAFPDTIQITFPDSKSTVLSKGKFHPRRGYLFRDDEYDPPGTPEFWIDPRANQNDFSFMWSGKNDEYDVIITSYKGLLSATITGIGGRFVIEKKGENYQLLKINLDAMPSHENDFVTSSNADNTNIKSDSTTNNDIESVVSNLKSINYINESKLNANNKDAINPNVVDLLIVYNELSRIEAGGQASNPNDTLNMEQRIIAEVDILNYTLKNSESSTVFTNFHMAKVSDFVHASGPGDQSTQTLIDLRQLPSVNNLRNQVGADLVVGIIDTNGGSFPWCGLANAQTAVSPGGSWTIGAGFSEFAYSITQNVCILNDNTFTHEIGHNMGVNHQRSEHDSSFISNVTNNGFPDAFAYQDGSFISITSSAGGVSRSLNFSNPEVEENGVDTGIVNLANAKQVIDDLTVFATNYRQRPDIIFIDGFE